MVASLYQIPRPLATAPEKKPKILIAFGRDLLYTLGKQCGKVGAAREGIKPSPTDTIGNLS